MLTPEQIFTPEQLHFHQQQQEEEQEQQQELDTEELDTEDPLITPSASIAVVEGTEEMEMEERAVDVREREEFERLFQNGCCERKCHLQFSEEYLRRVRWDMQELSKDQLEMAVMGQFMFATSDSDRERSHTNYRHRDKKVYITISNQTYHLHAK